MKNQFRKRCMICIMVAMMILSTSVFAAEEAGISYLLNAELDEWGIIALYNSNYDMGAVALGYERRENSPVTTDYERYILGERALGHDVAELAEMVKNVQLTSGKFADMIDSTGDELVNAHIWGVLSLYVAYEDEYDKEKALDWLREQQTAEGAFGVYVDAETGASTMISPDLTAMAVCAYGALGLDKDDVEVRKALDFVDAWIKEKEQSTENGASSETIAWQIMAKQFVNEPVQEDLLKWLDEYKLEDGTYSHLKKRKRSNYMATHHALTALGDYENGSSWLHKLRYENGYKDAEGSFENDEKVLELLNQGILRPELDGSIDTTKVIDREVTLPLI